MPLRCSCCRLDEFDELFCEALVSPLPGDSGATAGSNFTSTCTAHSRDGGSHGIRSASASTLGSRSSLSSCAA